MGEDERGLESITRWMDASQWIWRELTQLSGEAVRDSLRFLAEIQASAIETAMAPMTSFIDIQEAAIWYRKTVRDCIASMRKASSGTEYSSSRA